MDRCWQSGGSVGHIYWKLESNHEVSGEHHPRISVSVMFILCSPGVLYDQNGCEYRMFVQGDVRYDGHDQLILILRYMWKTIPARVHTRGKQEYVQVGMEAG